MSGGFRVLTEKTALPVTVLGGIAAFCFWIAKLDAKVDAATTQSNDAQTRIEKIAEFIPMIDRRLARIEGSLESCRKR